MRARAAVEMHAARLRDTGWVGAIDAEPFESALVAWDASTSHGELLLDPTGSALLLRGGYVVGEDRWEDDGRHSTEAPDTWGEFAAVSLKKLREGSIRVQAFSDPAGSWPIYYGQRHSSLVVSNDPHLVALALGLTELSAQGAFELLAYSHALDVETTIEGVVRLFPGDQLSVVATQHGVRSVAITARPRYAYRESGATQLALEVDALGALRRGATQIGVLSDGRFAHATVQLSGGLDSRLTAAVLADIHAERPDTVTLDLSDDSEIQIAREVAAMLGYGHRVASLSTTDLETVRVGWLLTGGQVSPYAAAGNILSYETAHRDPDGRILLVGAWPGDCLIGSYVPVRRRMTSRLLRRWAVDDWASKRGYPRTQPAGGVTGRDARQVETDAVRRLRARLRRGSGFTAAQRISYWAMFSRQPAFSYIAPAMLTSHVLPVTPVLAQPYLSQLMRLSGSQIIGKNFYRAMIAHGYPELAAVAYASTGRAIDDVPVKARLLPASLDDLYSGLPVWAQRVAHLAARAVRGRPSPAAVSAEVGHWETVFAIDGAGDSVTAQGIQVQSDASSDLHLRSVAKGLRWTADYLQEGADRLETW